MCALNVNVSGELLPEIDVPAIRRTSSERTEKSEMKEARVARLRQLLGNLYIVKNSTQKAELLDSLTQVTKPTVVSFVNSHGFNIAEKNAAFAVALQRSDIVLRDGIGMSVLMKMLRREAGLNMNGTDFIPEIMQQFAGRRVALCGTQEPYLSRAAEVLQHAGCELVLVMDGFQPASNYASVIAQANPELVILGMGMPKQEAVSMALLERIKGPMVIVNGGAILDFWAQRFPRAPRLMRILRMEWVFRLYLEPKRLWKRYLTGGIRFLGHIITLK